MKEYIAEDNEEMAVKLYSGDICELRTYSNFHIWDWILLKSQLPEAIICDLWELCCAV